MDIIQARDGAPSMTASCLRNLCTIAPIFLALVSCSPPPFNLARPDTEPPRASEQLGIRFLSGKGSLDGHNSSGGIRDLGFAVIAANRVCRVERESGRLWCCRESPKPRHKRTVSAIPRLHRPIGEKCPQ